MKPCIIRNCQKSRYRRNARCLSHMREHWREIKNGSAASRQRGTRPKRGKYNTKYTEYFGDPMVEWLRGK